MSYNESDMKPSYRMNEMFVGLFWYLYKRHFGHIIHHHWSADPKNAEDTIAQRYC